METSGKQLFKDLGANATLNVKKQSGRVLAFTCDNENAAARYLQLHDTATVPASSDPPKYSFRVGATAQLTIGEEFFGRDGSPLFLNGIAFAFSTAKDVYTAGTASEQSTHIHYV